MTGTTNDGAGRRPPFRPPAEASRPAPPTVPSQRASSAHPAAREIVVPLEATDESLDRVVAAAREAQASGAVLRLVAAAGPAGASADIARERLTHRLDMAAEVARALCPGLTVEVTGPEDAPD